MEANCSFFISIFLVFFKLSVSVDLHLIAQPHAKATAAGIMTDTETMKLNANQCKKYKYINICKVRW